MKIKNVTVEAENKDSILIVFKTFEYTHYTLYWAILKKETYHVLDIDDSFTKRWGFYASNHIEDYMLRNKLRFLLKGY